MIGPKTEALKWLIDAPDGDYEVKKWHPKRSLTANAYFHVLVGKIAEALGVTNAEIKNSMIARYGQIDTDLMSVIVEDSRAGWERTEFIHLRPTSATRVMDNGRLYRVCLVMRGSHTYDSAEMARLIDGTVEEAKELGIETLPPHELERLKGYEKHHNG